jgi:hypothetical protein
MCLNRTDVAFKLPSNDHGFVAAKISNIGIELIHQAVGNGEFHQQSWPSQQKKAFTAYQEELDINNTSTGNVGT